MFWHHWSETTCIIYEQQCCFESVRFIWVSAFNSFLVLFVILTLLTHDPYWVNFTVTYLNKEIFHRQTTWVWFLLVVATFLRHHSVHIGPTFHPLIKPLYCEDSSPMVNRQGEVDRWPSYSAKVKNACPLPQTCSQHLAREMEFCRCVTYVEPHVIVAL